MWVTTEGYFQSNFTDLKYRLVCIPRCFCHHNWWGQWLAPMGLQWTYCCQQSLWTGYLRSSMQGAHALQLKYTRHLPSSTGVGVGQWQQISNFPFASVKHGKRDWMDSHFELSGKQRPQFCHYHEQKWLCYSNLFRFPGFQRFQMFGCIMCAKL